ncbi:sialate O-acetylesterase [Niabella yanshanensis]|uniref:Sialate O-acetylesterase n=1 Tax=Niabella yanshanensis TaxID=577386 RepID=A0ABZ0WBX0_9BACT|nr:sialate O-acetylesterase [Niabella yanshanensis]WQD39690.1 sialate O-acetylesterase [Niabella yanshanensis]
MKLKFVFVLLFLAGTITTRANVKLPALFQNHMVLQRDKPCTIWGTAANEEKITVTFNNAVFSTTARNGQWKIILPRQPAGGPYTIIIKGNNLIKLSDVLFGDVWICGGQSNMQFSVKESKPQPDTASFNNNLIRLFTVGIGADFVPQQDVKNGAWKIATVKEVNSFTAAGFFFGSYLQQHLKVPIGLISSNLGATAIEEWMSNDAIKAFPQFRPFYNSYILPGKSMKEMTDDFEKIKHSWKKNFYLKDDPGLKEKWYLPETDTENWKTMNQPSHWEDNDLKDYDGSVWFRKTYDSLPRDFMGNTSISLGQVDDYNTCWVNGVQIGEGFGNMNMYTYKIPDSILRPQKNVVVVRVFDAGGKGGMYNMFWNPFLAGSWKYKRGVKIDASIFQKPLVANSYIFGTPTILYNANIAPLTSFSVTGFIWYQGEANTGRAAEYKQLLPAMITDWRKQFNQGALPFLLVQLPNFGKEPPIPEDNDWAELREAQASALRLPKTAMAVTIDIGEADNLHPHNKLEVGNRLAMAAMDIAYRIDSNGTSACYKSMQVKGDSIIIELDKNIECRDKYGYIRGFAMAGADNVFYWAKASVVGPRSIIVYNPLIKSPLNVRYLWSGEPGIIDLYSKGGLPVAPFRTDSLPLKTEYNFYEFLP